MANQGLFARVCAWRPSLRFVAPPWIEGPASADSSVVVAKAWSSLARRSRFGAPFYAPLCLVIGFTTDLIANHPNLVLGFTALNILMGAARFSIGGAFQKKQQQAPAL